MHQSTAASLIYLYVYVDVLNIDLLRFLIHQSTAGAIIGKGGANIKQIREDTGVSIKVTSQTFSSPNLLMI